MTADEVKAALRRRHPAVNQGMAGAWTVIEEFGAAGWGGGEIDLLALSAWQSAAPCPRSKLARFPRVGYEVKVSRGDLRSELLRPGKRALAVAFCNYFYLATPQALLSTDEILWEEPDWMDDPASFEREPCPSRCYRPRRRAGGRTALSVRSDGTALVVCSECEGRGYAAASRVEREAPTLWIPRDVGLVTVSPAGSCHVVKEAPVREVDATSPHVTAHLARWISVRPDPRHAVLRRMPVEERPEAEVGSAA